MKAAHSQHSQFRRNQATAVYCHAERVLLKLIQQTRRDSIQRRQRLFDVAFPGLIKEAIRACTARSPKLGNLPCRAKRPTFRAQLLCEALRLCDDRDFDAVSTPPENPPPTARPVAPGNMRRAPDGGAQ